MLLAWAAASGLTPASIGGGNPAPAMSNCCAAAAVVVVLAGPGIRTPGGNPGILIPAATAAIAIGVEQPPEACCTPAFCAMSLTAAAAA